MFFFIINKTIPSLPPKINSLKKVQLAFVQEALMRSISNVVDWSFIWENNTQLVDNDASTHNTCTIYQTSTLNISHSTSHTQHLTLNISHSSQRGEGSKGVALLNPSHICRPPCNV